MCPIQVQSLLVGLDIPNVTRQSKVSRQWQCQFKNHTKMLNNKIFKTKLKYLSTMVISLNLFGEEFKSRLYLGSFSCSSV